MARVYIRGVHVTPTNTLSLAASANEFLDNATNDAPEGGGLDQIDDVDIQFYNNVMFVIAKDLS